LIASYFFLCLLGNTAANPNWKYVITPFGIRPEQCVLEVPHDSLVTEGDGVVYVKKPDVDEVETVVVPSECHLDIPDIHAKLIQRKKVSSNLPEPNLDINGWLDYGGWYPPTGENNLYEFTVTQTVPGNPTITNSNQVLFYFIGMQDNDSPAVNIIQPVLTWGNGNNAWYLESWACCPSNITVNSPALTGLKAGSQFQGVIQRTSPSTWKIDSIFNGQHTTLNAQVGDYNYNWADVTLEVYNVVSCSDFATGQAVFSQLVLTDSQKQTITPSWTFTGATSCTGKIVQTSPSSIYIQHGS
jgi:hypothetical protein